jgi:hypothetical protein
MDPRPAVAAAPQSVFKLPNMAGPRLHFQMNCPKPIQDTKFMETP